MRIIILDTNFLMLPYSFHLDIFSRIHETLPFPCEIAVIAQTIDELTHIAIAKKGKPSKAAKLALDLIKAKDLKVLSPIQEKNETVDDILVRLADEEHIIATQDQALKKRLKEKNAAILVIREKRYLELM